MKRTAILRGAGVALLSVVMPVSMAQTGTKDAITSGGSMNLIAPPPASGKTSLAEAKSVLVRHPTQAGRVNQTMSGNFVPSAAHSWLAKGDKHYSLCATTKADTVACSPLVAASVLTDLELGTIASKDGITLLTFKTMPGTKRLGKALAQAAGTLMQRVAKMSAHLERRAALYAPRPSETSLRAGATAALNNAGGGTCVAYDDSGAYDCESGGGGGESSGGGGGGDYPSGNDNGDPPPPGAFDPTTGEGINPDAPEVIIVGQRPEQGTVAPPADWVSSPPPMPAPVIAPFSDIEPVRFYMPVGCIPGPRGTFVCPPPVVPDPFELPKPRPGFVWKWKWSDIEWCKIWNNCAPIANESEQPPAVTPGEKFHKAMAVCRAEAKANMEFCVRMQPHRTVEENNQCGDDAIEGYKACEATAVDILNHQ